MPRKRGNGVRLPYRYTDARGNVRWKASIDVGKTASGKRKQKQVTRATYAKCKAALDQLQEEYAQYGNILDHDITFSEYANTFLTHKESTVDPATYKGYRTDLLVHCAEWGATALADFSPATIRAILDKARNDGCGIDVRRRIRIALNGLMKMALGDGLIRTNPVSGVRPPSEKDAVAKKRRAFSVPELREMLRIAATKPIEEGAIFWWWLLTGMRQGEYIGCYLPDLHLDLEQPLYVVNWKMQSVPSKHGCGTPVNGVHPCGFRAGFYCPQRQWRIPDGYDFMQIEGSLCFTHPKSASVHRIPLLPELAEVLRRYLAFMEQYPNPHQLLFRHRDGRPIRDKEATILVKGLMTEAGMDQNERTGHESRYALVTLLRRNHVDEKIVEGIVGHGSRTVDDIYYTVEDMDRTEAMEEVGEAINLKSIEWKEPVA